jgi:hypothetical protein
MDVVTCVNLLNCLLNPHLYRLAHRVLLHAMNLFLRPVLIMNFLIKLLSEKFILLTIVDKTCNIFVAEKRS